jgi:hypothetical protein
MPPSKPLGRPKDDKMFLYTYTNNDPINTIYKTKTQEQSSPNLLSQFDQSMNTRTLSQPKTSLINASKLEYNIVNNSYQPNNAATNWGETKRKFPISKFVHDGRTYAPNYTQGYDKKDSDREFARKTNLCGNICEIQKNYGTGKFFRKFK